MTEEDLISRYGREKVEAWKKAFQNATIRNDFIFCKAMQNMNICKEVLRLFLQDTIEIKSITPQSTIDSFLKSKAVRLDVLVEDRNGNHYDIEMQVVISDSIAKRMRMYQASIDVSTFEKGKDYKQARETLIKARRAFNQRFLLTFSSCHKLYVMATYRKLMNLKG